MRILVIGHVDHGKTEFICALNQFLFKRFGIGSEDRARPTVDANNCVLAQESVGYSVENVDYAFFDYPGYADYLDMFDAGQEKFDAALIVCAATDGPMPQTRALFEKCLECGIDKYVVYMSKADIVDDDELLQLTAEEVLFMMEDAGYSDTDSVAVVYGGAYKALTSTDDKDSDFIMDIIREVHKVCKR